MTTSLTNPRCGCRRPGPALALLALGGGLALTSLASSPAMAQAQPQAQRLIPAVGVPGDQPGGQQRGPQLTPAQEQQLFPSWRSLALQGVQARQAILQRQQQCVSAAGNLQALKDCMRQERQAMKAQRQEHRAALQQLFQRYGIPLPQRLQGQGQGHWGGSSQGGAGGPSGGQ
ncbi:MAG: hypothetical protein WCF98_06850 [Synechococcus sp. ELA057]